nr:MAG TPA: hypothetical protein [Caudoviricetes sp.]
MLIEIVLTLRISNTSFICPLETVAQCGVKDIGVAPVVLSSKGPETAQECEHVFLLCCHINTSIFTISKKMLNVNIAIDII